jgi:hypothetical protein
MVPVIPKPADRGPLFGSRAVILFGKFDHPPIRWGTIRRTDQTTTHDNKTGPRSNFPPHDHGNRLKMIVDYGLVVGNNYGAAKVI